MSEANAQAPRRVTHDAIQPFMVDGSQVRGRAVRLNDSIDKILGQYDYPPAVARCLGELLMLAALLSSNLKHEGIITLQAKGDGPVPLMVVDATFEGALRGYAQFDKDVTLPEKPTLPEMLGKGYLAITLDQGDASNRYQGIVELQGDTVADAISSYFAQSQQIDVALHLAVGQSQEGGDDPHWIGGGIMVERLPANAEGDVVDDISDNDWQHATVLLETVQAHELLDSSLALSELLYRLYHEDGVWVFEPHDLRQQCRCSRERIESVLMTMPKEDIDHMQVEGVIAVNCQFCNTSYEFDEETVERLFKN
ncbi:MAG: molecular chaperone Hsp33 [Rickettsiales bacterium]|nr:molecular chaperone Hsp33 [Rickettsiales bacterium]